MPFIINFQLPVILHITMSLVNLDSKLKRHVGTTNPDAPNFSRDIRAPCEIQVSAL